MDIKEKISKVMKQAVDHCEVMGVNLLVENGVLNTRGYGNRIVYLKSDNQDIK